MKCSVCDENNADVQHLKVLGVVFKIFFFQAEDGIRDWSVTGVQTCALPILGLERDQS